MSSGRRSRLTTDPQPPARKSPTVDPVMDQDGVAQHYLAPHSAPRGVDRMAQVVENQRSPLDPSLKTEDPLASTGGFRPRPSNQLNNHLPRTGPARRSLYSNHKQAPTILTGHVSPIVLHPPVDASNDSAFPSLSPAMVHGHPRLAPPSTAHIPARHRRTTSRPSDDKRTGLHSPMGRQLPASVSGRVFDRGMQRRGARGPLDARAPADAKLFQSKLVLRRIHAEALADCATTSSDSELEAGTPARASKPQNHRTVAAAQGFRASTSAPVHRQSRSRSRSRTRPVDFNRMKDRRRLRRAA